jgi:hypothetical protein
MTILRHALIASGMEEGLADGAILAEENATEPDLICAIDQWRAAANFWSITGLSAKGGVSAIYEGRGTFLPPAA